MSLETRSNSALFKRAEQLRRWEESDTNREPVVPKQKSRKIKFSSGCVFLAACASGDKDEVLNLLEKGADINTANVDGLTALHQACIDDNLDMVEFLVEHGADVNRGDNEGWTPLHATASCGFLYIARYLIDKGADVAAVNNDGELAIDIAECEKMKNLLNEEVDRRGIDCDAARSEEERLMLRDAKEWLATKSSLVNSQHPKHGATALHVASAKGYTGVMKILLQCDADVDAQDVDGWTPMHAAAHWGQSEAAQLLAEGLADMEAKNYVGQTPFDVSDTEMFRHLEQLREKQNREDINRRQAKKRAEKLDRTSEAETPSKVKKIEVEITAPEVPPVDNKIDENIEMEVTSESESETESSSDTESSSSEDEKKNRANTMTMTDTHNETETITSRLPPTGQKTPASAVENNVEDVPAWRKTANKNSKAEGNKKNFNDSNNMEEVTLRRSNSLNSDTSSKEDKSEQNSISTTTSTTSTPSKMSPASSPLPTTQPLRRSFVPPVRDEESETQRKAHAKRVRETRRSTQGVTLEEIKSAEQYIKKSQTNNKSDASGANGDSGIHVTATITTATPTVITRESEDATTTHERRPSWRLRVDNGSCKFKLEDATKPADTPSTPSFVRRSSTTTTTTNSNNNTLLASQQRPTSAPVETADATVTLPLRRPKSLEEKEQDKENDVRNAQATLATQAAIQRRRRPKRRSTGVVNFDNVDDPDQDKESSGAGDLDETKHNHQEFTFAQTLNYIRNLRFLYSFAFVCILVSDMSFRSSKGVPTRHRSSSSVRSNGSVGGYSRPRSLGYFGSNTSAYSSPYSSPSSYSPSSYSNYTSNYQSPYFPNGYRGSSGSSGYASLTIPAKALTNINVVTPSYSKTYDNSRDYDGGHRSRRDSARSYANRERSLSRSRNSLASSGMGSRSLSMTSLNSDTGYCSGVERSSRSRISSNSDIRNENGEIDYKKLYEQQLVENDRLKDKLKKSDEELRDTKQTLERINVVTSKNSLSELEKRERRAMERKLSEMEEELKHLEILKSENQRLKDENGALIRVISKLSK
ncbi:unnamed protein product [Brassicogethes aeneus]|uniref:Protein phosphatase 1 regulatory subunit 12B n=1 Tax=Brassicogethes aeneus TaxID=1431903 RepID=A0A9P0F911_BRAAE|nr:unnamed protein product [Brassicogethes aeneus]